MACPIGIYLIKIIKYLYKKWAGTTLIHHHQPTTMLPYCVYHARPPNCRSAEGRRQKPLLRWLGWVGSVVVDYQDLLWQATTMTYKLRAPFDKKVIQKNTSLCLLLRLKKIQKQYFQLFHLKKIILVICKFNKVRSKVQMQIQHKILLTKRN